MLVKQIEPFSHHMALSELCYCPYSLDLCSNQPNFTSHHSLFTSLCAIHISIWPLILIGRNKMIHLLRTNEDVSGDKSSKAVQLSAAYFYWQKKKKIKSFVHKARSEVCCLAERYNTHPKHTQTELVKLKYKHKSTGLKLVIIGSMT